jgi:hypothetical protein
MKSAQISLHGLTVLEQGFVCGVQLASMPQIAPWVEFCVGCGAAGTMERSALHRSNTSSRKARKLR